MMNPKGTSPASALKNLKRKLDQDFQGNADEQDRKKTTVPIAENEDTLAEICRHVEILNSKFSPEEADRTAAKAAAHDLSEVARNEDMVDLIVSCGAVPALVKHLEAPWDLNEGWNGLRPIEHEVERDCALALGFLVSKPEYQQMAADAGAIPRLVNLLKRHNNYPASRVLNALLRRAADAITNLAHENARIKSLVRAEGGIPPIVELLQVADTKIQKAAAGALRTLAFRNDENKNQIVHSNALPLLILMLKSEDSSVHNEAIGAIGNLVHSSPDIKKEVLLAGALQSVIRLLSSNSSEAQREAALLLGQFASVDADCKVHIAQRGGIEPLVRMLQSPDVQVKEMAAFALGRLALDKHNQAGIAQNDGIAQLLRLLDMKAGSLQHNAAFALYGLADNDDNVAEFIRVGGIQKLQDGEFIAQPTKDCVARTLKRLEDKIRGPVLDYLLYIMRVANKIVQKRVALALAHLCAPDDGKTIFIDNNGLELLLQLLDSTNLEQQLCSSAALYKLATKASSLVPEDAAPLSPTQRVYLGEKFVNDPTLSDISFLVEGKRFYAHKICLLASSDAFRAMFDGGYRETNAQDVEIPNIRWEVFELMMRYIYTGSVNFNTDIAHDLLKAADQYLLDGLKRLCEYKIAQDISEQNVLLMYELSDAHNATALRHSCISFMLESFDKLSKKPWFKKFLKHVMPEVRRYITKVLNKPTQANKACV